jgi:hypothetical protein
VVNPVLTDEQGKRIYSSQETDQQPNQTIYESKFVHPEDVKIDASISKRYSPEGLPNPADMAAVRRLDQPGPFFVNMADRFRIQNRIMGHLKDKFESDNYESLKQQSNVSKHVP